MNATDFFLIGGAAFVAYLLLANKTTPTVATGSGGAQPKAGAKLIQVYAGWQYFSDGTSISPDGRYFQGDTLIYTPDQPMVA